MGEAVKISQNSKVGYLQHPGLLGAGAGAPPPLPPPLAPPLGAGLGPGLEPAPGPAPAAHPMLDLAWVAAK